jgi:hypothetical protein
VLHGSTAVQAEVFALPANRAGKTTTVEILGLPGTRRQDRAFST